MSETFVYYIWFKFFSLKDFIPLKITSEEISIGDLKEKLIEYIKVNSTSKDKEFSKIALFKKRRLEQIGVEIYKVDTKEKYEDDSYILGAYHRVLVERVPTQYQQAALKDRYAKRLPLPDVRRVKTNKFEKIQIKEYDGSTASASDDTLSNSSTEEKFNSEILTKNSLASSSLFHIASKPLPPSYLPYNLYAHSESVVNSNLQTKKPSPPPLPTNNGQLSLFTMGYTAQPSQSNDLPRGRYMDKMSNFREDRSRSTSRYQRNIRENLRFA